MDQHSSGQQAVFGGDGTAETLMARRGGARQLLTESLTLPEPSKRGSFP
jgi:hypothetical protein